MFWFRKLLFYVFILSFFINSSLYACDKNGGNDGPDDTQKDSLGLQMPPIMPPDMPAENVRELAQKDGLKIDKDIQEASDRYYKEKREEARKIRREWLGIRQKHLGNKLKSAFNEKDRADRNLKIASDIGYVDAAAGAIVSVLATGGAGVTVAAISTGADAISSAAGSLSQSFIEKKSFKKALLNAALEGGKKATSDLIINNVKIAHKAGAAIFSFTAGQAYDNINARAKNIQE